MIVIEVVGIVLMFVVSAVVIALIVSIFKDGGQSIIIKSY